MIGSTNHLDSLDPAISKRPSRFDRKYHFQIPSFEERKLYCEFWRKKLVDSELVDFDPALNAVIAGLSEGFSFAYLKELFVIALLTIARGGHVDEEDEGKSETSTETVMVEHEVEPVAETAVKEGSDAKTETGGTEGKEKAIVCEDKKEEVPEKKKRTLPVVDVPEHLKDNQLLKVIKNQLQILLDEMDNTKEEDWPSDKPKGGRGLRILRNLVARPIPNSDDDCC
jgi:transitional endoplasmic reticulum ATPase